MSANVISAPFASLGKSIDNELNYFVVETTGKLISVITPWALAGVTLYIVIYGYMIMTGRVQEYFYDFAMKCVKIILIAAFALNAPLYTGEAIGALEDIQAGIVSAVTDGGINSIYQQLDENFLGLNKHLKAIDKQMIEKKSSWMSLIGLSDLSLDIFAWVVKGILMIAYAAVLISTVLTIITAHVFLKILFGLGAFFVMCLLFPPTARFFDNWIGAVMSNIFTFVIGVAFSSIALNIFFTICNHSLASGKVESLVIVALGILMYGVIFFVVSTSITSVAAGLGGGVAAAGLSAGAALAAATGLATMNVNKRRNLKFPEKNEKNRIGKESISQRAWRGTKKSAAAGAVHLYNKYSKNKGI